MIMIIDITSTFCQQLRRPNVPLHDADVRPLPGGDGGDRVVPAGRRDEGEDEQDAAELRRGPLLPQLHERKVSVIVILILNIRLYGINSLNVYNTISYHL